MVVCLSVSLVMDLLCGRQDVGPKRWTHKRKGELEEAAFFWL